jgi:hypothetical protein
MQGTGLRGASPVRGTDGVAPVALETRRESHGLHVVPIEGVGQPGDLR